MGNGAREFITFLGKVEAKLDDPKWLFEATDLVRDEAVKNVNMKTHGTGELAGSIYGEVRQAQHGLEGVVYTDNDHAHYVEFGTGSVGAESDHSSVSPNVPLVYSGKKYWRYQDDSGNWHTTSGQPAKPFLYPALKDNTQKILDMANKDIKKAVGGK